MTQLQQEILTALHTLSGEPIPAETIEQVESQRAEPLDIFGTRPGELYLWDEFARILLDPDINHANILEYLHTLTGTQTLSQIIRKLDFQGLLNTDGSIVDDCGVPALKLAYQKYLSWFRGYSFQVSMTSTGHVSCGSSDTSLRRLNKLSPYISDNLYALLFYSFAVEAAGRHSYFNELQQKRSELVDDFMNRSLALQRYENNRVIQSWVHNPVIQTSTAMNAIEDFLLQAPIQCVSKGTQASTLGVLTITKNLVAFDRMGDGIQFYVDYAAEIHGDLDEDDNPEEFELDGRDYQFIQERISVLLLHHAGVWLNSMGCGKIASSKIKSILASKSMDAITSGNELYSAISNLYHSNVEV